MSLILTHRRVAAVDDSDVVGVDVDTSTSVDVAESDAEMLAAGLAVTQVAVERSFDGAVRSRRTRRAELLRLASVDLSNDADHLSAAVQRDVAAVTTVLRPLCFHHIIDLYVKYSLDFCDKFCRPTSGFVDDITFVRKDVRMWKIMQNQFLQKTCLWYAYRDSFFVETLVFPHRHELETFRVFGVYCNASANTLQENGLIIFTLHT